MDSEGDSIFVGSDIDHITEEITDKELRLVLLGKTGSGKSHTGCTILGTKMAFKISFLAFSCTQKCQHMEVSRFGKNVRIVDTPGLMDTDRDEEEVHEEIAKCVANSAPGVHAFLVVVRSDTRMTKEERDALDLIQRYFGNDIYEYMIIVITHKDHIDEGVEHGGKPFPEWLEDMPVPFQQVYEKCGRRAVVFDNREKDLLKKDEQVKKLLDTITDMLQNNGQKYYTDKNLQKAEKLMRDEAEKKRKAVEMKYEEARRRASEEAQERFLRLLRLQSDEELQKLRKKIEQLNLHRKEREREENERKLKQVEAESAKETERKKREIELEAKNEADKKAKELKTKQEEEERKAVEEERERLRREAENAEKPSRCIIL